jgi:hypothetical protein
MKFLHLWALGWGGAAVAMSVWVNVEMYHASRQLDELAHQMDITSESIDTFSDSLDATSLMLDMQFDDILRDVQVINCNLEPDYEMRVACALKIKWPRDI